MPLSELRVDALYRNTANWKNASDEFNVFFRFPDGGINNAAGFRPKKKAAGSTDIVSCAFCLLVTNFGETEWPDDLDPETGIFTYFGDNRSPGRRINETNVGGNRLLEFVFGQTHLDARESVPPILCFEKLLAGSGAVMRFLGLACPGVKGVSALEDLVAVWRIKGRQRFQNYRSLFTILRTEVVSRLWLDDLVNGKKPTDSPFCPDVWRRWVKKGIYTPLQAARQVVPRTKIDQMAATERERAVLNAVHSGLSHREFEFAAADIVELMDTRFMDLAVTRFAGDRGRDVLGTYRVGHGWHKVSLSAAVEAKHWGVKKGVGVKPMARLISRLRHRDLGVFMTTGYFDRQVQEELIEDRHPVILVSGGDIARILIAREIEDPAPTGKLGAWLDSVKSRASAGPTAPKSHWKL